MTTHTYVILELSPAAYNEIKDSLEKAGYGHAFHKDMDERLVIDMHGLAVAQEYPKLQSKPVERLREVRIDQNERGAFECWEPDGCGPGKHALFATEPTMEEALTHVCGRFPGCVLTLTFSTPTEARFTIR